MARPIVTPEIREVVVKRDKECVYCHKPVAWVVNSEAPYTQRWRAYDKKGILFQFDHRLPLSAGGSNTTDNIVLACPECNLAKARSRRTKLGNVFNAPKTKPVKLEDAVYNELKSILWRRETFSHGVKRLLETRRQLLGLGDIIEGVKGFEEAKIQREDPIEKARLQRADLEQRRIRSSSTTP